MDKACQITSASNPRIREALAARDRRDRRDPRFFIEGPHLIEQAMASSDVSFSAVFFSASFPKGKEGRRILRLVDRQNCFELPDALMRKLCDTESPQGIAAVVTLSGRSMETLSPQPPELIVVLDAIQDPGNLGTMIRTADAAGASAVLLLPGTCDPLSPKTVRATAGSVFHIPVVPCEEESLIRLAHERAVTLVATAANADLDLYSADLRQPVAIVFGNEARGVRPSLRKAADMLLRIPVLGKAESLNVGASSAVVLYEAVRQRR